MDYDISQTTKIPLSSSDSLGSDSLGLSELGAGVTAWARRAYGIQGLVGLTGDLPLLAIV